MGRIRFTPVGAPGGIVGFDLSLTAPAACFIPHGWELGDWDGLKATTYYWDVAEDELVKTGVDSLAWQYRRIISIVGWAQRFVLTNQAAHVLVENYAFSKSSSSVTRLAELGGHFRAVMYSFGYTVRPVVASSARKLILGHLPPKDVKIATQQAIWDHGAGFADGDQVDAFCIANAGLSELGLPFLSLA